MSDARYPIGKFAWPTSVSPEERARYIDAIATTPARLREAAKGLSDSELETPYREGGWTIRQVVHHLADSHMNSFIRFKLTVTEDQPTVKPYDEKAWALLSDVAGARIETSLCLLGCLHERWVVLLRSLTEADWKREFRHPERGLISLEQNVALYAWHGDHHIAHITALRAQKGWQDR